VFGHDVTSTGAPRVMGLLQVRGSSAEEGGVQYWEPCPQVGYWPVFSAFTVHLVQLFWGSHTSDPTHISCCLVHHAFLAFTNQTTDQYISTCLLHWAFFLDTLGPSIPWI